MRFATVAVATTLMFTISGCGGNDSPTAPSASSAAPSAWPGELPARTSGERPVCQATLPSFAQCINELSGPPQAICQDKVYSCSPNVGTCSTHGGVYCWRNP